MTILLPGMPASYGMPVMRQPVYITSLAQLPPTAVPLSQGMLAQALGQGSVGAQVVQPRPSLVGSVLKGAGVGAAAGAAFGIIPFLPLGLVSGAVVGAGVGAAIGLVKGLSDRRRSVDVALADAAHARMDASTPPGARSAAVVAPPKEKVVMGPEMRKRFAARVRAERAAAASK